MMLGYKSNHNVVYSSKYHVVWCPKCRRKVLVDKVAERLFNLIPPQKLDFKSFGINRPRDRVSRSHNHPNGVAAARIKTALPWLREVSAPSLQQTGCALDTAYRNWFDSLMGKRPDKVKPPTLSGEPSSVVLSMTPAGRYYVSFQVEQPLPVVGPASHRLSVDMNTKAFNFFNGRRWSQVWLPRPWLAALSKLRTAQKRLSRCEQGSKNREKARSRVAHICQRVTDLRTDFLQKLSTQLIHKNQVIMVETLGTKNLLKNRRLARAILDAGFGEFVRMLEYKCKWHGRTLVKVGEATRNGS